MLIIGVTGSLATGKSTVARMWTVYGAKILDADQIAHTLMKRGGACFGPVVRHFGKGILTRGVIDRKKLAQIVFRRPEELKSLCRIIHPAVIREVKRKIAVYKKRKTVFWVVIDAPLLIETGLDNLVDYCVVVKANQKLQIARVMKRAHISKQEAVRRMRAQMSIKEKLRFADIVIDNRGSLKETQTQVRDICQRLLKRKIGK